MPPLVEQLQRDALDSNVSISALLRKAKVVASKLELTDILHWINNELDGYDVEPPAYRVVSGRVMAHNPVRGWQVIHFDSTKLQNTCSSRSVSQKIAELEILANNGSTDLQIPFAPEQERMLMNAMRFPLSPTLMVSATSVTGILDAVRNTVLDWSLELEKRGITGEGMSFSEEDKHKAHQHSVIYNISNIGNFTGNMGNASGQSSVSYTAGSGVDLKELADVISQLAEGRKALSFPKSDDQEFAAALTEIQEEMRKPQLAKTKLSHLLGIIVSILQSATSSLLAKGALVELEKYRHLLH